MFRCPFRDWKRMGRERKARGRGVEEGEGSWVDSGNERRFKLLIYWRWRISFQRQHGSVAVKLRSPHEVVCTGRGREIRQRDDFSWRVFSGREGLLQQGTHQGNSTSCRLHEPCRGERLNLSLLRVINFKFLLRLHQKYYITQYEELGF